MVPLHSEWSVQVQSNNLFESLDYWHSCLYKLVLLVIRKNVGKFPELSTLQKVLIEMVCLNKQIYNLVNLMNDRFVVEKKVFSIQWLSKWHSLLLALPHFGHVLLSRSLGDGQSMGLGHTFLCVDLLFSVPNFWIPNLWSSISYTKLRKSGRWGSFYLNVSRSWKYCMSWIWTFYLACHRETKKCFWRMPEWGIQHASTLERYTARYHLPFLPEQPGVFKRKTGFLYNMQQYEQGIEIWFSILLLK